MTDQSLILRTDEAGVTILTLNSPQNVNALSSDMLSEFARILEDIAADNSVRAVVLRTAGKNFSAGHNLKELEAHRSDPDGGRAAFERTFAASSRINIAIHRMPQPVIAEVKGVATAAGCQLVAVCDLAIAADDARFATSGVNIGLFCSTPMVPLSRNMPRKQAMEMLLLGDFIPAARVAELGLVNRVVPRDDLEAETEAMARQIASKSPVAIRMGKAAFYRQLDMSMEEALAYGSQVMAENMMARDTVAGIGAFIAKRPMPEWKGE